VTLDNRALFLYRQPYLLKSQSFLVAFTIFLSPLQFFSNCDQIEIVESRTLKPDRNLEIPGRWNKMVLFVSRRTLQVRRLKNLSHVYLSMLQKIPRYCAPYLEHTQNRHRLTFCRCSTAQVNRNVQVPVPFETIIWEDLICKHFCTHFNPLPPSDAVRQQKKLF